MSKPSLKSGQSDALSQLGIDADKAGKRLKRDRRSNEDGDDDDDRAIRDQGRYSRR